MRRAILCLLWCGFAVVAFHGVRRSRQLQRICWESLVQGTSASLATKAEDVARELHGAYTSGNFIAVKSAFLRLQPDEDRQLLKLLHKSLDRSLFNIGLQALLEHLSVPSIISLLDYLLEDHGMVQSDTFNTFLSVLISQKMASTSAQDVFAEYVLRRQLIAPTTRTLNIMLELARTQGTAEDLEFYISLYRNNRILKDSATYATIARASTNVDQLAALWQDIVFVTKADWGSSRPLTAASFRCFLETFGTLGHPSHALYLSLIAALHIQQVQSSKESAASHENVYLKGLNVFKSRATGDALITALCQQLPSDSSVSLSAASFCHIFNHTMSESFGEQTPLPLRDSRFSTDTKDTSWYAFPLISPSLKQVQPAVDTFDVIHHLMLQGIELPISNSSGRKEQMFLKCSGKGYCQLFRLVQARLRVSLPNSQEHNRWRKLRDALWCRYRDDLDRKGEENSRMDFNQMSSHRLDVQDTTTSNMPSTSKKPFAYRDELLNGRIVDALLRCYLLEAKQIMPVFWRQELLPFLKRSREKNVVDVDGYYECLRSGFDAMMYLSGYQLQADFALDIARTINKRIHILLMGSAASNSTTSTTTTSHEKQWREQLYQLYLQGKRLRRHRETTLALPSLSFLSDPASSVSTKTVTGTTSAYQPAGVALPPASDSNIDIDGKGDMIGSQTAIGRQPRHVFFDTVNDLVYGGFETSLAIELGVLRDQVQQQRQQLSSKTSSSKMNDGGKRRGIEKVRIRLS